ncbi:hypothetical protein K458DRAFT_419771 [Lentithecium fluviatile CBS 122367]|uniref:Uncharacterized protein n=1 Tax=Lentithecium fluviatile CBS 122367 TaxID=1168545 RepID=A0A6G1IVU7_9PLEO|nr:hypothetical protein K458DRAFT_419771 [Lentithecium fluviatile CBS 122367]
MPTDASPKKSPREINSSILGAYVHVSSTQENPPLEYLLDRSMTVHRKHRTRLVWYVNVGNAAPKSKVVDNIKGRFRDHRFAWSRLEIRLSGGQVTIESVELLDGDQKQDFQEAKITQEGGYYCIDLSGANHKEGNNVAVGVTVAGNTSFTVKRMYLYKAT